jgi:hypothetical protein
MQSGLYQRLTEAGKLLKHQKAEIEAPDSLLAYKVVAPEIIGFISYPYEWSFEQLKQAALITLKIQKIALPYGLQLKDGLTLILYYTGGALLEGLGFPLEYREYLAAWRVLHSLMLGEGLPTFLLWDASSCIGSSVGDHVRRIVTAQEG